MKNVVVLGSTGSIGTQALDVVRSCGAEYNIIALCAGRNTRLLRQQAEAFKPRYVGAAADEEGLLAGLPRGTGLLLGPHAPEQLAALPEADVVVMGISGFAALRPLLSALRAGKRVALANKESVVCAKELVFGTAKAHGGEIIPVDSEQSAIFQCLAAGRRQDVKRLILTASGGPFRCYTREQLEGVKPGDALKHPTWRMGKKITVDSASLFNKGLEILEAANLFDIREISVLIHPESIVHSLVEFRDGSTLAQLSGTDMRLPIQYALDYPARKPCSFGALDLAQVGALHFHAPDTALFPALPLAYAALREGVVLPIVYNGANEAAVELFLQEKIPFTGIAERVEYAMARIPYHRAGSIEEIEEIDREARRLARKE